MLNFKIDKKFLGSPFWNSRRSSETKVTGQNDVQSFLDFLLKIISHQLYHNPNLFHEIGVSYVVQSQGQEDP